MNGTKITERGPEQRCLGACGGSTTSLGDFPGNTRREGAESAAHLDPATGVLWGPSIGIALVTILSIALLTLVDRRLFPLVLVAIASTAVVAAHRNEVR